MFELGCGKWGRGSLRDLSKNISTQGVGKGQSCLQGGGFEGVTIHDPPPGKF